MINRKMPRRTEGEKIYEAYPCSRCGGSGIYTSFHGVCFRCGGSGVDPGRWKRVDAKGVANREKARARAKAKREAAAVAREVAYAERKAKAIAEFKAKPFYEDLMEAMGGLEARRALGANIGGFAADVIDKYKNYGSISDKAAEAIINVYKTRSEDEKLRAKAGNFPEKAERMELSGKVLSVKEYEGGHYYNPVVYKITMKLEDGRMVFGSAPGSLDRLPRRGEKIRFMAAVEASRKDPKFGIFKRPTKAEFLLELDEEE